jgi:GxxExxY protein
MVLLYKEESYRIRGAAFNVYKALGCGHKEKVYQRSFEIALKNEGLKVEREKRIDVFFEQTKVGMYVPDFLIDSSIIVELKAKEYITKYDLKQCWHYLTSSIYQLGFLINFGKPGGVQIERRIHTNKEVQKKTETLIETVHDT